MSSGNASNPVAGVPEAEAGARGDSGEPRETGASADRARYRFDPRVERLGSEVDALSPFELFARLTSSASEPLRSPILLDSASGEPRRFSLVAFDPLPPAPPASIRELREYVARLERVGDADLPHFAGGFLGALSYDLGSSDERLALPRDPWASPTIVGGLYVDFVVRDEVRGTTHLVLGAAPGDGRASVDERARRVRALLARVPEVAAPVSDEASRAAPTRLVEPLEFRRRVACARDLIERGEIYQANLSHRVECALGPDAPGPIELYGRLRALHPGPFLGYVAFDGGALLSGSPELLVEFDPQTRVATTRPIKGTIARGATAEEDVARRAALLASAKDRAELAMIVDLERNDLGRCAEPGGVSVDSFPRVESYATVHHLVADVHARVRRELDGLDVLDALFPGGSVTGAPKLRSMEVIAALEGEGRGFAYGSMVLFDTRGRTLANILIRTLTWRAPRDGEGARVTYRVGGGITWASDPAAEDEESVAKGRALWAVLAGD